MYLHICLFLFVQFNRLARRPEGQKVPATRMAIRRLARRPEGQLGTRHPVGPRRLARRPEGVKVPATRMAPAAGPKARRAEGVDDCARWRTFVQLWTIVQIR